MHFILLEVERDMFPTKWLFQKFFQHRLSLSLVICLSYVTSEGVYPRFFSLHAYFVAEVLQFEYITRRQTICFYHSTSKAINVYLTFWKHVFIKCNGYFSSKLVRLTGTLPVGFIQVNTNS